MKDKIKFGSNSKLLNLIGLALVSSMIVYFVGCGGETVSAPTCNVPQEAYLNTKTRIGGAVTSVNTFNYDNSEWTVFNIANELKATQVSSIKSTEYSLEVDGFINDIVVLNQDDKTYALLAMGDEGISAVNITDPLNMVVEASTKINYLQEGLTWTEGGGDIVPDNIISSSRASISSLAIYDDGDVNTPIQLLIGDEDYGIHKTSLSNLFDTVNGRELDGTLKIESEVFTLQYAGENPWGGPKDLKLFGEGNGARLFVARGFLGIAIYNPQTLEQVGQYNLYTDATENNRGEDWFIDMDVSNEVQSGNLDICTGMPDYNQASYEIVSVWKGGVVAPTPWADFDRYGKYYYDARKIDIATFTGTNKTIAYIAYGLAGVVAVDVTGYDTAVARVDCTANAGFLEPTFMGYAPAVPAHGPDKMTGEQSESLFPYFGAGKLVESGVVDVKVDSVNNKVYFSDHFAGLSILDNADDPTTKWHGPNGINGYSNDTSAPLGDHWPDYEFVTSYDMTPISLDDEAMPKFLFELPLLLTTGEVSGHGSIFTLSQGFDPINNANVDVLLTAGGGGLSFLDLVVGTDQANSSFTSLVHFATTDEIGAAADGTATQEINIGHSEGITAYRNLLVLADGPHGISAWQIADEQCIPTDDVHIVANSLQDEYPVDVDGVTIYPAPHAYDVIFDNSTLSALVMTQSRGVRRINNYLEGTLDLPKLLYPTNMDIFEHNKDAGNVVDFLKMQDHAYDVALKGTLAFTADGSNGLTVYDLSKDPTISTSGYIVSNLGGETDSQPSLGRATGVKLWTDQATSKTYAFVASGHAGIGVVDVSDESNMILIKVFEPIKIEDDTVGKADGKSSAVQIVGDNAFFTYDSFGIVSYSIADLISPLIEGTDPTSIWGSQVVDQRPTALARFKLQDETLFGSAELSEFSGGATGMDVVSVNGRNLFYVAYGDAGLIKIDWTNPSLPILMEHSNTVGSAADVVVINGRAYVADGSGGLVLFK